MPIEEILPDAAYGRGPRQRWVIAVEEDEVIFVVDGITSLVPFRLSIAEFSAWVEKQSPR